MDYQVSLLHGLPPLPKSLNNYGAGSSAAASGGMASMASSVYGNSSSPGGMRYEGSSNNKQFRRMSPGAGHVPPPVPPPRPHGHLNRHSHSGASSSTSTYANQLHHGHSSPEHHYSLNRTIQQHGADIKTQSSSPARSLSSSPHSPHNFDSGLGRSSADSFSSSNNEPRAFVRVIKPPQHHMMAPPAGLDTQLIQLKKDMQHLRQMDMSLLGHLLSIHQGIQDLRNVLMPPPQPAPSASSSIYHRQGGHDAGAMYPMVVHDRNRPRKSSSRRDRRTEEGEQSGSLSSIEFGDV